MRLFSLSIILTSILLSCGSKDQKRVEPRIEALNEFNSKVDKVKQWAPVCKNGMLTKEKLDPHRGYVDGVPTVKGSCDDTDYLLFGGLTCLSGKTTECKYIKQSQDKEGRVWRSPYRVNKDKVNSFSRDMSVGFLAYVAKTKDSEALKKWVKYVADNKGMMCNDGTDNRCESKSGIRTLAYLVGRSIGVEIDWQGLSVLTREEFDAQLYGQARFAELGYPMHLVAAQILILDHIGIGNTYFTNQARQALFDRQPLNPLFAYVAQRSDEAVNIANQLIPSKEVIKKRQWSYEREEKEKAHINSMGHEWIMLQYLINK